ncbi:MAG: hypothetical protein QM776_17485 [Rhodocyclaceae bacterium]
MSALVWLVFGALLALESPERRIALCLCLVIATLGEVFLSLVWGLYDYRLHNIPLFVPPGHVLLFWFGMQTAQHVPGKLLDAVPAVSGIASLGLLVSGIDGLSLALWGLFMLACFLGRHWKVSSTRFYAWMFVLALVMEVFATRVGNWTWRPVVPVLGWSTLNPPLAAGTFYCMLDLLVFAAAARVSRFSLRPARDAEPSSHS